MYNNGTHLNLSQKIPLANLENTDDLVKGPILPFFPISSLFEMNTETHC